MEDQHSPAGQPQLVSDEINDIISRHPHWVVRYGNVIFLFLLLASIAAAAFIRYPDIISTQATLTSTDGSAECYALLHIAQKNHAQVNNGQQVLLKFYAYPFEKYGIVKGRLRFISDTPTDSGYLAKVIFTNNLNTTSGKQIRFREGLLANAEIITSNMSLLKRLVAGKIK